MINHAEAQSLVSARQDAPLDPIVARELDAHLATCPQCRAFAASTLAMTRALQDLPHLPASPQVRRTVLEAIQKPVSPWNRVQGYFAPSQGFAWSTVAAVALVAVLSILVVTRLLNNPDDNPGTNLLQAPSISATTTATQGADLAQADLTPTPPAKQVTATTEPTQDAALAETPAATDTVAPTTTDTAVLAATEVPTETPVPATEAPTDTPVPSSAPTETPAPVEPTQPAPTATSSGGTAIRIGDNTPAPTDVPTEPAVPTETPVEATEIPTETPVEATEVPTDTPVEATDVPTETPVEETEVPTDTPVEPTTAPTETRAPTAMPTETATEESPPIEPVNGTYESSDGTDGVSPTVAETALPTESPDPDSQMIVPASTPEENAPTIGPSNRSDRQEHTPSSESLNGGDSGDPGTSLGPVDPGTQITAEGDSWASYGLVSAPQVSDSGVSITDDRSGGIAICTQDGACQPLDQSDNRRTGGPETAIGWIGEALIVERGSSDGQVAYYAITINPDGSQGDEVMLGNGDASTGNAFVFGSGLLIETRAGWFTATDSYGTYVVTDPPVANRQVVRLYPESGFVGSIEDGRIVFENVNNGAVIGSLDTTGIDFDLSGDHQVAVSTGSSIEIWDLDSGSLVTTFTPPSGDGIGSVTWLSDGSIAYVDVTIGEVRSIAPSDFSPRD